MKKILLVVAVLFTVTSIKLSAASAKKTRKTAIENAKPIRTIPESRPKWVDSAPKSTKVLSFIGMSDRESRERDARNDAQEDARKQLIDYYGTEMVNKARTYTAKEGIASDVMSPQTMGQALNERISKNVAQSLEATEFFTQVFFNNTTGREEFEVTVLMEIDKTIVKSIIDKFGKDTAADLQKKAAAEQDAVKRQQLEKAAEFFGGNLSSSLGF